MAHPLCGAKASVLSEVLKQAGGADEKRLAPIRASIMGRAPFTALEERMISGLRSPGEMPAPIFILGHWRSGTTHLYNILSQAQFGYVPPIATGLPAEILTLGRWLRPLLERQLPDSRYIDNVPVTPTSPQEDEIALANLSPLSFYHGIYFPKAFDHFMDRGVFHDGVSEAEVAAWETAFLTFMGKLDRIFGGAPLLIKNPVYTARPASLRRLFPKAKFVHIHRDPFAIFPSMQNFYRKLFPVMALQPFGDVDIDETVLSVFDRMMERFTAETKDWTTPSFVEVSYDELSRDPLGAVEGIYDALELPDFEEAAPAFTRYLRGIEGYEKNRFQPQDGVGDAVRERWSRWLDHWGYARRG
jgi:hypothetical protein